MRTGTNVICPMIRNAPAHTVRVVLYIWNMRKCAKVKNNESRLQSTNPKLKQLSLVKTCNASLLHHDQLELGVIVVMITIITKSRDMVIQLRL